MLKCQGCPLAGRDAECVAQRLNHPRTCELVAAGSPGQAEMILRDAATPIDFTAHAEPTLTMRTIPAAIPLAESLRLLAARKACPSYTPDGGTCGCNGTCAEGKGRGGKVSRDDCFACLTSATPAHLEPIAIAPSLGDEP